VKCRKKTLDQIVCKRENISTSDLHILKLDPDITRRKEDKSILVQELTLKEIERLKTRLAVLREMGTRMRKNLKWSSASNMCLSNNAGYLLGLDMVE